MHSIQNILGTVIQRPQPTNRRAAAHGRGPDPLPVTALADTNASVRITQFGDPSVRTSAQLSCPQGQGLRGEQLRSECAALPKRSMLADTPSPYGFPQPEPHYYVEEVTDEYDEDIDNEGICYGDWETITTPSGNACDSANFSSQIVGYEPLRENMSQRVANRLAEPTVLPVQRSSQSPLQACAPYTPYAPIVIHSTTQPLSHAGTQLQELYNSQHATKLQNREAPAKVDLKEQIQLFRDKHLNNNNKQDNRPNRDLCPQHTFGDKLVRTSAQRESPAVQEEQDNHSNRDLCPQRTFGDPSRRDSARVRPTKEDQHAISVIADKSVCHKCRGAGYLRADVPFGDPRFGKAIACECKEAERKAKRRQQLREMSNLDAFRTQNFETFNKRAPGVQEAYNTALAFLDYPANWLLLTGPTGCGKTHLAAAIAHQALENESVVLFEPVPDLLANLRSSLSSSGEAYDDLFAKMREVELLILDDLGSQQCSPWANEKIFQLLNYRYNMTLPTVITANRQGLQSIDERIQSRLSDAALVIRVPMDRAQDYRPKRTRNY